jgi:hypothetical protein
VYLINYIFVAKYKTYLISVFEPATKTHTSLSSSSSSKSSSIILSWYNRLRSGQHTKWTQWNDEVKEDEMSRICSMHLGEEKGNQVGKILLGRPRHKWEDEYEMDATEI